MKKIKDNTLDDFTYIVPRTGGFPEYGFPPNTQHPSEDIRNGEELFKRLYETLRNSEAWEDTLLLITYDEHGGFWDSVTPTKTLKTPVPGKPGNPD